ncbi:large neutral amino acids transporter small subunit 4 [Microcaecilia unicolor]|uniref:Large neutral amino acids transporter small subunit 4-like n=1 Tax=Microcaecilia unicolor TaxID=1415580 RepID=A0A6P7YF73_9AMPH|nr:large neutral amino acids transporter small subunit 4-like [Microcaecilia unicolor]
MASSNVCQPGLAPCRRWWLISTALTETLLFSGVLLGWNSLLPILKSQGIYSHLCDISASNFSMVERGLDLSPHLQALNSGMWEEDEDVVHIQLMLSIPTTAAHTPEPKGKRVQEHHGAACKQQEDILNLAFTLGSFFLGFTLLPLQVLLETIHLRQLRQIGSASFSLSCLLLAYVCSNSTRLSFFLMFAMMLSGIGGACILFTTLTLPVLLGSPGPLYTALVLGCFCASATVFTLMRVMYSAGVSFLSIILAYGGLSCLMFINCFFCWSIQPCNAGTEGSYSIHLKWKFCEHQQKPESVEMSDISLQQHFLKSLGQKERILPSSQRKTVSFHRPHLQKASPPLSDSLCSPVFIFHLFMVSIVQLWLHFYFGSINHMLQHLSQDDKNTGLYSSIFGALQVLSLLSAPMTSLLLGSRQQKPTNRKEEECAAIAGVQFPQRQISSVRRLTVVFTLRIIFLCAFGVVCLIPSLELQVLGFLLHTVLRSSLFVSCTALYVVLYPANHFGGLIGVHILFSMLLTLGQHLLSWLLQTTSQGNPFWIHASFLTLSLLGFIVPFYLHGLRSDMAKRAKSSTATPRLCAVLLQSIC